MKKIKFYFAKRIATLILFLLFTLRVSSQCINNYPHTENFELAPTWTAGGVNSDWAWGTPAKTTISGAGGGTKSWCIGGLTGSAYNNAEQSFIKSPCYDFSTLTYPYVSFKVFWESEWLFDGASLQYSINNGVTWTTVGSFGDPVNCMTQNWYTKSNINFLAWITPTNKNGWAGNAHSTVGSCQGGNGSLAWVLAKHCLNGLAGQPNVIFRFTFGSGTTCNSFDGFAIDDFSIDNAPPNSPAFTYTCSNFTALTSVCPVPSSYLWNFGDIASGAANTSNVANPTHNFSAAGIYTVSLTTSGGPCNAPGTTTQTISVLGASISTSSSITCFGGSNGSATATVMGNSAPYSYTWLPSGGSGSIATGLAAGIYTLSVFDINGCNDTKTVSINQPSVLVATISDVTLCQGQQAVISSTVSGGTIPYSYQWLPSGITTYSIAVSPAVTSTYTLNVTDANNCNAKPVVSTVNILPQLSLAINTSYTACIGAPSVLTATASGGNGNYQYLWLPGNLTGAQINPVITSNMQYTVIVSDGCSAQPAQALTQVNVSVAPTIQIHSNQISGCPPLCTSFYDSTLIASGNITSWYWTFSNGQNSSNISPYVCFNNPGNYTGTLTVITNDGCLANSALISNIIVHPIPTANFSSNTFEGTVNDATFNLNNTSLNSNHFLWETSTGTYTINPISLHYESEGVYPVKLIALNNFGCKDSIVKYIKVDLEFTFYAPNAFTPNTDIKNEVFMPLGNGWKNETFVLEVFDRWGVLIYKTTDTSKGWDGKIKGGSYMVQEGVYVWKVELYDMLNRHHSYIGHVTLLK